MKKITFILFALIAGTAFGQETATANAAADIVSPLVIAKIGDMNFGRVANNLAGTVVLATDGTTTGLDQIGTTTTTAAEFNVTAADGFAYIVTLPTSATLTSGTDNMTVDTFTADPDVETSNPVGNGNTQLLKVGATLNVAASQATGNYTGAFDVTVAYE